MEIAPGCLLAKAGVEVGDVLDELCGEHVFESSHGRVSTCINVYSGASLQGTGWGQVLCPLYSGASLQGTVWAQVLCPLYSGASLQGTSWGQVLCPLYGGASQVRDRSFVPYTVEPLYKEQVGDGSFVYGGACPLTNVLCSEVVLLSEGLLSEVPMFLCPL